MTVGSMVSGWQATPGSAWAWAARSLAPEVDRAQCPAPAKAGLVVRGQGRQVVRAEQAPPAGVWPPGPGSRPGHGEVGTGQGQGGGRRRGCCCCGPVGGYGAKSARMRDDPALAHAGDGPCHAVSGRPGVCPGCPASRASSVVTAPSTGNSWLPGGGLVGVGGAAVFQAFARRRARRFLSAGLGGLRLCRAFHCGRQGVGSGTCDSFPGLFRSGTACGHHSSAVPTAATAATRAAARARRMARSPGLHAGLPGQPRWLPRMPASSNMPALSLPNTARSLSSATMVRLVLRVLQVVGLDVFPHLLHGLGAPRIRSPMTAASAALGALPAAVCAALGGGGLWLRPSLQGVLAAALVFACPCSYCFWRRLGAAEPCWAQTRS